MHMMGDGRREPETPRERQIFPVVSMTNDGTVRAFVNAEGLIAVINEAGAVRWMRPANIDAIVATWMPVAL